MFRARIRKHIVLGGFVYSTREIVDYFVENGQGVSIRSCFETQPGKDKMS